MHYSCIAAIRPISCKVGLMRETMQESALCYWRPLILGAVNGVLVGATAYRALWLFVEYKNQRSFQEQGNGGDLMHATLAIKWYGLPVVGAVAFALSAYLIHRYFAHRLKSILLVWQTVGAASIMSGVLIAGAIALINQIFGSVSFDYAHTVSWDLLWIVLSVFGFVALINLLYGTFIQIATKQYSQYPYDDEFRRTWVRDHRARP